MQITAKIEVSPEDIEEIENQLAETLADELSDLLSRKSKSEKRFYDSLASTITSEGNAVVGSGLTAYILRERPQLFEEFLPELINKVNEEGFIGR